jgi:hypothetical protein
MWLQTQLYMVWQGALGVFDAQFLFSPFFCEDIILPIVSTLINWEETCQIYKSALVLYHLHNGCPL